MQTGNINYIYRNDLDKACFQHDINYGKYKVLKKITESDKVLREKAFKIASNPKYDGYQRGLASVFFKLKDKKSKGSGIKSMSNQQLASSKTNYQKIKKKEVYSLFKDNIWAVDLSDYASKYNKVIRFLFY